MSLPPHPSQNPANPRLSDDTDAAANDGPHESIPRRQIPINQVRTSVHAIPSSATAIPPPTPLTAAHGGNLGSGFSGAARAGESGGIWGRVQSPFVSRMAATHGNRMVDMTGGLQAYHLRTAPVTSITTAHINPVIRNYARIAAVLYAARIRPSDAPPFTRELAHAYPIAQALAIDLSRHAGSPRSRRRRRHITLRRVNVFTVAKFTACTGMFLAFLRIWTILSLAITKSLATFLSMDDVNTLLAYLEVQFADHPHEYALYNELLSILQHDNPFEALSTPVSIGRLSVSPLIFIAALITTPFLAGAVCFLVGVCFAVAFNALLSLSGGIRLENRDD